MKRTWLIVACAALLTALRLIWAFALEPASLTTQGHELAVPQWNAELSNLRVAVLPDLHMGSPFKGISKLERIVLLSFRFPSPCATTHRLSRREAYGTARNH